MYKIKGDLSDYTNLDLALMVLLDVFGSGYARKKALAGRYYSVQSLVNQITSSGEIPVIRSSIAEEKIRKVFEDQRPTDQEYQAYVDDFINALKEENS